VKPRHKRALMIVGALATLAIAAVLILNALNSNIALYVTPSEVAAGKAPKGQTFRIGGMVKDGSLKRDELVVHFIITDLVKEIPFLIKAFFRICLKRARALLSKVSWIPMDNSLLAKCLLSMMRITCRQRQSML